MDISNGIQRALDGDAILFVGAGFSSDAINLEGKKFKRGSELAKYLSIQSGIAETSDLEDAAEAYADELGSDKLIELIQNEFTAKEIQSYHEKIATIPWKRIYTTNYDNIIETAFRNSGKRITPITLSNEIYKIPKDHCICIHLNGYVENLDREKILTELKLTETSYVTSGIADTPWAMLFRQDLRLAHSIFFIGYSLFDLDIKRIIFESDDIKNKCFFYLGGSPADSTIRRVRKYGTPITKSSKDFIDLKESIQKSYTPRGLSDKNYISISEYSPEPSSTSITLNTFLDLLLFGKRSNDNIYESLGAGKRFVMERTQVSKVLEKIQNGHNYFAVTSDLGNGKSIFLEGLRFRASELGYRVFDVLDRNDEVIRELEHLAKIDGKKILIIEEYQNWIDEISVFCSNASQKTTLIVTARNAVNDIIIDDLYTSTGAKDIIEINIDILDDDEIDWIIDTLDEYGLWGSKAGLSRFDKFKFLERTCNRQFHSILLKLFESPEIGAKLKDIEKILRKQGSNHKELLSVLVLTILNHAATADILSDIWGANIISSAKFRKDPLVNEFVSFNFYAALVRSPVAAKYLIQESFDINTVTSVLIQMIEKIEKGSNISPRYNDVFKSLSRYGSIQSIFPDKGKRKAVIEYYDSIKHLDNCKTNPLFWLQYAIACLVNGETLQSGILFDTAYSIAHKKGWNTFQIDNHYARYLMIEATQVLEYPDVMDSFRKARDIINRQIQDERRHYPYRVASNYQSFLDRFGRKMKKGEIKELHDAAVNVLEKISTLPESRKNHRHVKECKTALEHVVSKALEISGK